MYPREYQYRSSPFRLLYQRKIYFLSFTAIAFIIFHYYIAAPQETRENVNSKRPTPQHDIEDRPRYLHQSPFRESPDLEYEAQLSAALENIERDALLRNKGDNKARDRIWQIMIHDDPTDEDRTSDSMQLEHENSDWKYTLVTKDWATTFLMEILSTVPDLLDTYNSYPYDVLRADLLRYLILWYHGGYYADMDIFPAKSIKSCPSLQPLFTDAEEKPNVSLVLGIEIDEPYASPQLMRDWHWIRRYGFVQYNMYAPRRFSPLLREAIVRVLAHTKQHRENSSLLRSRYTEKVILEVTGPGVFTDAVLDVLSDTLPSTHELITQSANADKGYDDLVSPSGKAQKRVTWAPFHRIRAPLWVDASEIKSGDKPMDGLGVLPVSVWGNGQRHSGAENFHSVHACINHRFGGTWKKSWIQRFFG